MRATPHETFPIPRVHLAHICLRMAATTRVPTTPSDFHADFHAERANTSTYCTTTSAFCTASELCPPRFATLLCRTSEVMAATPEAVCSCGTFRSSCTPPPNTPTASPSTSPLKSYRTSTLPKRLPGSCSCCPALYMCPFTGQLIPPHPPAVARQEGWLVKTRPGSMHWVV